MIALTTASVLLAVLAGVRAQAITLLPCGAAFYDPSKYNCYNSNFLCPVLNGVATVRCGPDCYLPSQYSCVNNHLGPPSTSNTYTLVASAPGTDFDGKTVEASGRNFYIGGAASSYCPQFAVAFCPPGNVTAFGGGSLDVEVPGGQQIYLGPSGNISFTQAHSISYPTGSIFGGFDIKGGEASTFAGYPLYACPTVVYGGGVFNQVIAKITTVRPDCKKLTVLAEDFKGFGAWQYT